MQSRFVAAGTNKNNEQVLLAYELNEEAFRVDLYVVPTKALAKTNAEVLEKKWPEGESFEFPENTVHVIPNLNADTILPEDILSGETGKIRSKQNEWAYQLLTAKLWESYLIELEEIKKRAENLTQYERSLFDEAKSFWERVLEHRKERDISQERLDKIKDDVNSVFEKLKNFRKTESAEFEAASAKAKDDVLAKLETLNAKAGENANFKELLEELKNLQTEARKNRYTKADEVIVRKAFDSAFNHINEQRNHFFSDKNAARIKGLNDVIQKMEASMERDRKDLEYLERKSNSKNVKSLELQLNQLKTKMVLEAIASKEEKLKDIRNTLATLTKQKSKVQKKEGKEKPTENTKDIKDGNEESTSSATE